MGGDVRRVPDLAAALTALAECSPRLHSEVGGQTQQLLQHVEGACKAVVQALVTSLQLPSLDSVAYEKMWALRHIGKQSLVARGWIEEKGGVKAIAEVMGRHVQHGKLLEEGAWLSYVLQGVSGFQELLTVSRAPEALAATARALRELAEGQRQQGKEGCEAWPEGPELLLSLLALLRRKGGQELSSECCKALHELIQASPPRGELFLQHGGGEALMSSLTQEPTLAGVWVMTALVRGNARAAAELRSLGALDCLVKCGESFPKHWRNTMWTLGQVGGPLTVVKLMKSADHAEGVSVSLRALAKITWEDLEEFQHQLPEVLQGLLPMLPLVEQSPEDLSNALQALGGVMRFVAPRVPPGGLPELDRAVAAQLQALDGHQLVAQAACTCLAHMATDAWRGILSAALPALRKRWSSAGESKESCKELRDLLWAAGSIAGLPTLLEAMRQQPQSADLQHAALMAAVEICGEEPCDSRGVPQTEACHVVTTAMALHRAVLNVQSAGCEALGVLCDQLLPENFTAVMGAVRRFPFRHCIVSQGLLAFRRWLELKQRDMEAVAHVVALLRESHWGDELKRILKDFAAADIELLENCLFLYALLEGISEMLQRVWDGTIEMKCAAVQVLCDLCRGYRELVLSSREAIQGCVARLVASEESTGPCGEVGRQVVELQRRAEMLRGLLR